MALLKPPRPTNAPGTPSRDAEYAGKVTRKNYAEAASDPAVQELMRDADRRWGAAFARPRTESPDV